MMPMMPTNDQVRKLVQNMAVSDAMAQRAGINNVVDYMAATLGPDWNKHLPSVPRDVSGMRVTPEMRMHGGAELRGGRPRTRMNPEDDAEAVYRAMHAAAPVELVSEGERLAIRQRDKAHEIICDLSAERDAAKAHVKVMQEALDQSGALLVARARVEEGFQDQITALRTELMAARDALAKFTAANVPDPLSKAEHNPYREFRGDPRRVGS